MFGFVRLWVGILVRLFRCRRCLLIENLALRQQLAVFKRQNSRPRLAAADKLFWVLLRRFCLRRDGASIAVGAFGPTLAAIQDELLGGQLNAIVHDGRLALGWIACGV